MMVEARLTVSPARPVPRWWFRVGLADLIGWVLGVGVASAVFRGVDTGRWFAPKPQFDLILGTTAAVLAIFLGLVLLRQAVVLGWRGRASSRPTPLPAVAWRLAAVGLLGSFLAEEAGLLGHEGPDDFDVLTRTFLLPAIATLAMVGVVGGMSLGRVRPRKRAWLSVVWAVAAAVAIASTQAFVPYLILLALEMVSMAMTRPDLSGPSHPGLHDRVARAGFELIPALACCLFLGLRLSWELRRPARQPGERGGSLSLLAVTLATALGAAWLLAVTIPRLHESLAEGLWMALSPRGAAALALGLAGLAVGPSARAADRPGPSEPASIEARPRRVFPRLLPRMAVVLVLIDISLSRLLAAVGIGEGPWTGWVGWVDAAYLRFLSMMPPAINNVTSVWRVFQAPEWLVVAVAQVWIAWRVAVLLVTPVGPEPTPIDASLGDRRAIGRFAMRWAALTVLMLSSLPVLFVSGLVILHWLYRLG